jgi:hypothetical protein
MLIRKAAPALATLALAACTTTMTHQQVDAGARPLVPGLNYFLPKQVYAITATYEISSCPNANGTAEEKRAPLVVSQKASLAESSVADGSARYSIPYDTLTSAWKTTSLTATLYENQTLHTLGASADDRSGAIVKNVVGTILSIARLQAGVAAARPAAPVPALCTADVYTALKLRKQGRAKLLDPTLDDKQRAAWSAVIATAQTSLQFEQTYGFEPSTSMTRGEWSAPAHKLRAWFQNPGLIGTASPAELEAYQATLTTSAQVLGVNPEASPLPNDWAGHGVLYREPAKVQVEVCAGSCEKPASMRLARMDSWAGQFGRTMVFPLKNGPFEKNNLTISFAANGRLESFTYGRESTLEKLSASVAENATSVEGYLNAKRAADETAATEAAGAELAALQDEAAILEARAKVIEARNKLIGVGGQP